MDSLINEMQPVDERQPGDGATEDVNAKSSQKEMEVDEEKPKQPAIKNSNKTKPKVPAVNCPEKIVFVLDISHDMASTSFQVRIPRTVPVLHLVKKALEVFVQTKHTINAKHQFALILLQNNGVLWYQEFTNDIQFFLDTMEDLKPSEQNEEQPQFSLDQVMELLNEHCILPNVTDLVLPPPYVVRTIFIYGRSNCELVISEKGLRIFNDFQICPYFYFDALYVHEFPSAENKCQSIYNFLCELDQQEVGYILEVSRSRQRLYEHVAKLVAHPLQRTPQRDAYYGLYPCKDDSADEF